MFNDIFSAIGPALVANGFQVLDSDDDTIIVCHKASKADYKIKVDDFKDDTNSFLEPPVIQQYSDNAVGMSTKKTEYGVEDLLAMELACIAGAMEERKEISIPSWDDLSSAIADAIYEYYESNTTGAKDCTSVALRIFEERFKSKTRGEPNDN